MARVLKPPAPLSVDSAVPSIFLAGSIEMGAAEDWQNQVENALRDLDVVLLNPRRDEWDASWVQSIANPAFRAQVEWELEGLERASLVAMYFAPPTKSPVTLLELGLCARGGKLLVCCPEGFWRRGNVEVVCARYSVPLVGTLTEMVKLLRANVTDRQADRHWAVHRQDDNGNRFVVETRLSRADAERLAAELEARAHKQVYWIERES